MAKAPLASPSANTVVFSGQSPPSRPAAASPASASAEARQPPIVQARREPSWRPASRLPARAASSIPANAPPCWTPDNWVDWPGV